jgi:hypothetical protein
MAQRAFYDPDWATLAQTLAALDASDATRLTDANPSAQQDGGTASYPFEVFCQDWNLPVRDYQAYAADLRRIAKIAPDMHLPRALLATASCLGSPTPVNNPQHLLKVRTSRPLLLVNSLHDPASGYNWATNVARQLGDKGVLLTYEGWGHGAYNSSPCAKAAIDRYLTSLTLPAPGTRCPAVEP